MGLFEVTEANCATQLWIAARFLQSISLLTAFHFLKRKLNVYLTLSAYGLILFLLGSSIFWWQIFPDCFVEEIGLTQFKKISEYLISAILLTSMICLYRKKDEFTQEVYLLLVVSIVLTIASELAFTFYVSVYGISNLLGHFFKMVA